MKGAKPQKIKPVIRFKAKLSGPALILPKNASAKIPSRGKVMIEGAMNTVPFRTALESDSKGVRQLKVSSAMRKIVSPTDSDSVTVEITRVGDEPEARMPADLRKALAATPNATDSWNAMTPLARRDWVFSITEATQAKTRLRRIEKACDMLSRGKRRLCCFPGIKWVMTKNAKACGMWQKLPN